MFWVSIEGLKMFKSKIPTFYIYLGKSVHIGPVVSVEKLFNSVMI